MLFELSNLSVVLFDLSILCKQLLDYFYIVCRRCCFLGNFLQLLYFFLAFEDVLLLVVQVPLIWVVLYGHLYSFIYIGH